MNHYQSNFLSVVVNVFDLNDNPPIFELSSYSIYLDENVNNGTFDVEILQFKVNDKDSGIYGVHGLDCFLTGSGSEKYLEIEKKSYY